MPVWAGSASNSLEKASNPPAEALERLNKEVKRRAGVVGIFPNEASITRLIGAVLLEQNYEWLLQHRYMQIEGMAELTSPLIADPAKPRPKNDLRKIYGKIRCCDPACRGEGAESSTGNPAQPSTMNTVGEHRNAPPMRPATRSGQYRAGELATDRIIHLMGALAGVVCSAVLVSIAANVADRRTFVATLVYCVCLLAMLACSAAYNLVSGGSPREFLRRLDHAAIFLMIAGTYTPFTTCRLHGVWALGMTAAVWTGAAIGAGIKLICPHRIERVSIVAYLVLGWTILVGMRPMLEAVDAPTIVLIGVGGMLYSIGTRFYLWRALPFHNAIWHGFVLSAGTCHYAAILHGVVLARP